MNNLKSDLKGRVAKGLNYGIEAMEDILNPTTTAYNQFIALKSKYSDLMHFSSINTLSYEQLEIGFDKLRNSLLLLVDGLSDNDFRKQSVNIEISNKSLSYRRTNFFQLLEIHFQNLEKISHRITDYYDRVQDKWEYRRVEGREAIFHIYDALQYNFKEKQENTPENLRLYFKDFFTKEYGAIEVYLKNLSHILSYILAEEVEQGFFIHTLKAVLSKVELAMIYYYAFSGIDLQFKTYTDLVELVEEPLRQVLIAPEHLDWGVAS